MPSPGSEKILNFETLTLADARPDTGQDGKTRPIQPTQLDATVQAAFFAYTLGYTRTAIAPQPPEMGVYKTPAAGKRCAPAAPLLTKQATLH